MPGAGPPAKAKRARNSIPGSSSPPDSKPAQLAQGPIEESAVSAPKPKCTHARSRRQRQNHALEQTRKLERLAKKKEAKAYIKSEFVRWDKPGILGRARPPAGERQEQANAISRWVLANMVALEKACLKTCPRATGSKLRAGKSRGGTARTSSIKAMSKALTDVVEEVWQDWDADDAGDWRKRLSTQIAERAPQLNACLAQLPTWLHGKMVEGWTGHCEKDMYPWVQQLHVFIAHHIQCFVVAVGEEDMQSFWKSRLILPYLQSDRKAKDSYDQTRYDVILATRSVTATVAPIAGDPCYRDAFAIIEAEDTVRSLEPPEREEAQGPQILEETPPLFVQHEDMDLSSDSEAESQLSTGTYQALESLFLQVPRAFATQPDRRFVWGVTLHGPRIRAGTFTSAGAVLSHEMDLGQPAGLSEYVQLVVDWSLCNVCRLGDDPTIKFSKSKDCWEIKVPQKYSGINQDGEQETVTYYCDNMYVAAERMFGRHTRCFPAAAEPPRQPAQRRSNGSIILRITPTVLIKDSWRGASRTGGEMELGELRCLEILDDIEYAPDDPPECLPQLCDGGVVQMDGAKDTTDAVWGDDAVLYADGTDYYFEHVRFATTPIGKPLKNVRSAYELIIVVADAACAHLLAHKQGILHRDISDTNIMFRRTGNKIYGMLIDLDNAAGVDESQKGSRPICTGTTPFMSLNNLRKNDFPRTALDDMESFIYVLIWLGTWGATSEHRQHTRGRKRLISDWLTAKEGGPEKILMLNDVEILQGYMDELYHTCGDLPKSSPLNSTDQKLAEETRVSYQLLRDLITTLIDDLFYNQCEGIPITAKGSYVMMTAGSIKALRKTDPTRSPFFVRATPEVKDLIYDSCIATFKRFAQIAREKIAGTPAEQGSQEMS